MPGLVGALGFVPDRQDLFLRRALKEPFHGVEAVPGVRQGAAWIVHAAATPAGHGSCYLPDLNILVAYWGEFYDQEALRQPDGRAVAELLARRLAASLNGTLTGLDGSFGLFAQLPDGRQILVSDRVASRPIFYAAAPDCLLFAPDLSLIPALSPRTFPLDRNSLVSFVVNGHPIPFERCHRSRSSAG